MRFEGVITALATPFAGGAIDEERFRAFIEWQIEQGVSAVVPCGTTGESATLSHAEHEEVIRICVDQVKGRIPVIAGAGSNNTSEAISLTRFAKKAGASAALHITPYYNRPTQEGLYQHFKAIAKEVSFPLVPYNVPARTGGNLLPETVGRMVRDIPEIVAIKEASGNMTQVSNVIEQCGDKICVLSGDDFILLPLLALGGAGVISVTSNIAPKQIVGIYQAFMRGDLAEARRLHYLTEPINRMLFVETNPIPVKTALGVMGKMLPDMRLPMCPLQPQNEQLVRTTLQKAGLI